MRFEKVSIQQLFPTGVFANLKVCADIIINKGEDPKLGLQAAYDLVNEFAKEKIAEIESQRGIITTTIAPGKKEMDIQIRDIYDKAVLAEDTETIFKLSEEYNLPTTSLIKNKILNTINKINDAATKG